MSNDIGFTEIDGTYYVTYNSAFTAIDKAILTKGKEFWKDTILYPFIIKGVVYKNIYELLETYKDTETSTIPILAGSGVCSNTSMAITEAVIPGLNNTKCSVCGYTQWIAADDSLEVPHYTVEEAHENE